jgi:hypothetical protein
MLEKDREATVRQLTGKWVRISGRTNGQSGMGGDGGIAGGKQQYLIYSFDITSSGCSDTSYGTLCEGMKHATPSVECRGKLGDTAIKDFKFWPIREVEVVGRYEYISGYGVAISVLDWCELVP